MKSWPSWNRTDPHFGYRVPLNAAGWWKASEGYKMKFTLTLKDPDGPSDGIEDAARESLPEGLDADEARGVREQREQRLKDFVRQWLEYGEYARIEFDTEAGTATVLKCK